MTQTHDFYADISEDVVRKFDTSDYPDDHPSGIKTVVNKKVLGMFKDEACGKQIEEFVGLRAKLYSYKLADEEHKKCKGVKKKVVEKKSEKSRREAGGESRRSRADISRGIAAPAHRAGVLST